MDAVLTAVVGAAPQLGGTGLLVTVLVLLIRRELQTSQRHDAELTRVGLAHDAELAEKNVEIENLRTRNEVLNRNLDAERERRRTAEDSGRHRTDEPDGGRSPWAG